MWYFVSTIMYGHVHNNVLVCCLLETCTACFYGMCQTFTVLRLRSGSFQSYLGILLAMAVGESRPRQQSVTDRWHRGLPQRYRAMPVHDFQWKESVFAVLRICSITVSML